MIVNVIQGPPIGTNCYLLGDEARKVCAVVDPGGGAPAVLDMVKASGLELAAILLTHGHYDHTGAVADIEAACPGTPIYIHHLDAKSDRHGIFPPLPQEELRFYGEGDEVQVGSLTVGVLHTPGHTRGSVTLKVGDVLFTGDTLFRGSCGRTDLPGGRDDGLPGQAGGPARGLPGLPRPRGALHPGRRAEEQLLSPGGAGPGVTSLHHKTTGKGGRRP